MTTSPHPVGRPERWPRAVAAEPLYVARGESLGMLGGGEPGIRRSAYAVLVLLGLGLPRVGDGRIGADRAPWEVPVAADAYALAARLGLPVRECVAAVDLLVACGALVRMEEGAAPAATDAATLAPALFRPRPAAEAVDWERVLPAVEGSAPTLLVAWAFAELLRRPDRFASVPRAELVAHTQYGEGMVKRALARLVGAGVVDRSGANAYRFSDAALGRGPLRGDASGPELRATARAEPLATPSPTVRQATEGRVSFTVAGVALELPRDVTVELEAEVDGRPTKLRLRFPSD